MSTWVFISGVFVGFVVCALAFLIAALRSQAPLAPVVALGWQEIGDGRYVRVYNLTHEIAGHPSGSTVSEPTLVKAGYRLPEAFEIEFAGFSKS